MKRLILALALSLALPLGLAPAFSVAQPIAADMDALSTMSEAELIATADRQHPVALYILSARLFEAGEGQAAAEWMYIAQLRYRILLNAGDDSAETALFGALHEQVGRPINEFIGGDVDEWIGAIDAALAWDNAHDNAYTDKETYADIIEAEHIGLIELRDYIEENREEIPRMRTENGLENR